MGLKIQRTGLSAHITDKINKGKATLTNLTRFRNLTPKIKTTLIKTLLIPVIEYPPVPLCSISKTQKINLQKVLNRGLKFIHYNETERLTIKELHQLYNITPFNVSTHNKACKTWERVRYIEEEQTYEELTRERDRTHNWFPKTTTIISSPPPLPIYTSQS